MECDVALVKKLAEIAMLELSDEDAREICIDIMRIASYLKTVGEEVRNLDVDPLYHVWEEMGHTRDSDSSVDQRIRIEDLPVVLDERGYVRLPWRGGRIAGTN